MMTMEFDPAYFDHYGGHRKSYQKVFADYLASPRDLRKALLRLGRDLPHSIVDLGAADGSALQYFGKALGADTLHGVELSKYAVMRRVVDHIVQGDMRRFVKTRSSPFQEKYDLVLNNALMYLASAEIVPFLSSMKSLFHERTSALLTLPSFYPWGMHEYLRDHQRTHGEHSYPVIRPKPWWLQSVYEAGFDVLHDIDGNSLVVGLPNGKLARPPIFGDPEVIELKYEFDCGAPAAHGQINIIHKKTGLKMKFAHQRRRKGNKFLELGDMRRRSVRPRLCKALPDVLAFFRSGRVGRDYSIEFRKMDFHLYVPGSICAPAKVGFTLRSDLKI
jgi:hypothetical protein